jgi:DNA-binding transcriptional MocR family regulator
MASPVYQLIAQELRERIESGELPPGEQLPTELELRDVYGAARNTVRDAVRTPATLGLVATRQGQETFVAQRLKPFVTTLSPGPENGLTGMDIPAGGFAYLKDTLGVAEAGHRDLIQVRPPTEDEARFFTLADTGRVAVITCVRTGYRDADEGPVPFRVTCTVLPSDRNEFSISSGRVPLAQPAPAEG